MATVYLDPATELANTLTLEGGASDLVDAWTVATRQPRTPTTPETTKRVVGAHNQTKSGTVRVDAHAKGVAFVSALTVWWYGGEGEDNTVNVRLKEGTTTRATSTESNAALGWHSATWSAGDLPQSALDDIRVEVEIEHTDPSSSLPRVYAVYVELVLEDNFTTLASASRRRPAVQLYLEGMPDVLCTSLPIDPKAKTRFVRFDQSDEQRLESGNETSLFASTGNLSLLIAFRLETNTGQGLFEHRDYATTPKEGVVLYAEAKASAPALVIAVGGSAMALVGDAVNGSLIDTNTLTLNRWYVVGVSIGGDSGTHISAIIIGLDAAGLAAEERSGSGSMVTRFVGTDDPTGTERSGWTFSTPIRIGQAFPNPNEAWLDGDVSYAAVYDAYYSVAELRRLAYRVLGAQWPQHEHLLAHWVMEEGAGTTVRDEVGGYDLTLAGDAGTPSWQTGESFPLVYRELLSMPSAIGQSIDPRATRSSIASVVFRVLDAGEWMTRWLAAIGYRLRNRSAYVFLGFAGLFEDEYQIVMRGAIESVQPLAGRGYEIRIGDAQRVARTTIPLGRSRLNGAINNSVTSLVLDNRRGFGGLTRAQIDTGSLTPATYLRIDDEVVLCEAIPQGATQTMGSLTRGALGTAAAAHDDNATVEEVLVERDQHPINMALRLLMSRSGDNADLSGYDSLVRLADDTFDDHEGRGAGLSPDDIDVAQWLTLAAALWDLSGSTYKGSLALLRDVDDVKQFVEREVLRPLGAFLYVGRNGRLKLGRWHARSLTGTERAIEQPLQVRPVPSVDFSRIVNSILIAYDRELLEEAFGNRIGYEDVNSGAAHGRSEALRVDAKWIRTADYGGSPTFSPTTITDDLRDAIFARFADHLYLIDVTLPLRYWDVEVDDLVTLAHAHLPDFADGARGLQGVACQVVGRRLDVRRGRVELRLLKMSS